MDTLTLRTVFRGDDSNVRAVARDVDKLIDQVIAKARGSVVIPVQIGGMGGSGGGGGGFGGDPSKIIAATLAKIEQVEKVSASRQAQIAGEGEAKRAAIEAQGAQRRINAQTMAQARLESQEAAHLQKLIQAKEKAEQRLAMKPRMSAERIGQALNGAGNSLTMGVTAPVVAGVGLALNEGIKFESSFADVRKTVNGTVMDLEKLKFQLREMAAGSKSPIPIDINELNAIAASAGELGIKTPEVAQFTKTMAMLGTTTNLSSNQAATSLARIDNILGTGQKSFDRYGSALVDLGNNGASTESEIVDMSVRLAGEAKQIGLSASDVLAFGSALASVGVESEAGGTGVSKFWKQVDTAVRGGGKSLEDVAKVAGMSAAAFKKAWQDDAGRASVSFIEGLGKIKAAGGSAAGTLDSLGITQSREQDALLRLAGAGDLLSKSLKTGENAWRSNTAMAAEAGKRYETTASQLQILKNRARELAIQASEIALPGVNRQLKGFSDGLPENAQKVAAGYEALGPTGQKAVIGLVGIGVASGPILKVAGNVWLLVNALTKLGAWVLPSTLTASLAGLAPLLANPMIGIPLLVAALGLGAIAWQNYKAKIDDAIVAQGNAAASAQTLAHILERAQKFAGDSPAAKSALGHLQDDAKAAGQDTDKLIALIQKAADEKVTVGSDMKLSPLGKNAVQNELQRFINNLSAQTIELNVSLKGAVEAAQGKNTGAAQIAQSEMNWQQRAQRAGVALPASVPESRPASFWEHLTTGSSQIDMRGSAEMTHYNAAIQEANSRILGWERAHLSANGAAKAATQSTTAALTAQNKEVGDLTAKELAGEKKRLEAMNSAGKLSVGKPGYDSGSAIRSGDVDLELRNRATAAKTKSDGEKAARIKAQGEAKADATREAKDAAIEAQKHAEALADQARADIGRGLQEQLTSWKAFESAIDGVRSSLGQTAESGNEVTDGVARAKMEAGLARREFDGIPQPLKESAIALAGIQAQLQKIVGTRDAVRQVFNGIFEGLGSAEQSKFAAFAQRFQNELKLAPNVKNLLDQAQTHSNEISGAVGTNQNSLQEKIRLNQLAGRGAFDSSKNPNDGNIATVIGGVKGNAIADAAQALQDSGAAQSYKHGCQKLARVGFQEVSHEYDAFFKATNAKGQVTAAAVMSAFKNAGIGYPYKPGMPVAPGSLAYTGDHVGGGAGHVQTVLRSGRFSDQYSAHGRPTTVPQWIVPPPGAVVTSSANSGDVATPSAPNRPSRSNSNRPAARLPFDPRILTAKSLPKAWGTPMDDYNARPGEQTGYREALEAMLQKLLNDGVNVSKSAMQDARKTGFGLDLSASRREATREAYRSMAGLNRDIRLIGRENNPYLALLDEFKNGAKRFETEVAKGRELGAVSRLMVGQTRQATREMRQQISGSVGANREAAPLLEGGDFNRGAYDRKLFESQKRREIWSSSDITNLLQAGQGIEANRQAVMRLNLEMTAFDSDRKQGTLLGRAELGRGVSEEARQIAAANELLRTGKSNAADVAQEVEKMAYYAKQYASYIDGGMSKGTAGMMAAQDTKTWEDNRAGARANSLLGQNTAASDQARLTQEMAEKIGALNAVYGAGSVELEIQNQLLQKRYELLQKNTLAPASEKLSDDEIKTRMDAEEKLLRTQAGTQRNTESQTKVREMHSSVLDEQMRREQAGVESAKKRLEIELRYEQKKRDAAIEAETAAEAAAREQLDGERRISAAQEDRRAKAKADAEQVKSGFMALLNGDLGGMRTSAMERAKNSLAERATRLIVKKPKKAAGDSLPKSAISLGQKFIPHPQKNPGIPSRTSSGDMAGAIRQALSGGIRAARVEVHTATTQVHASSVNVSGGGNGGNATGLLGMLGMGSRSGGGSGTAPTAEQTVSSGAMLA